jgi:multimeric flavodoxin WrbA
MVREELETLAAAAGVDLQIETIPLGSIQLSACRGCRSCFDRGEDTCPVKDDMKSVREKMRAADGLLVASPVYVDDVSGLVKSWIDRTAYACHRPEYGGKCAFALVTTGGSPTSHALRTLTVALGTWGYHIVGTEGVAAGARMSPDEMRAKHQARLHKVARRLFSAIHERKFARPTFLSLMMFRIQQIGWKNFGPGSIDYAYWENQGWFKPGCDYYIPHQGSRVKAVLAGLTGTIIARFVS